MRSAETSQGDEGGLEARVHVPATESVYPRANNVCSTFVSGMQAMTSTRERGFAARAAFLMPSHAGVTHQPESTR